MKNKVLIGIIVVISVIAITIIGIAMSRNSNQSNVNGNENNTQLSQTIANGENKILIAYFSQTGNTDKLASEIQEQLGGDLFKIEPVKPYPTNMQELLDYTEKEQEDGIKPEIKGTIENIDEYDTIFIGYPIWWYEVPQIIKSFLDQYDLSGKTIVPFNTHEGSGDGGTYRYIEQQEPNATVLEGLPIRGRNMSSDQSKTVKKWLEEIGLLK